MKWGVALYLVFMLLVPVNRFQIAGLHFGRNVFSFVFLVSYFYYAQRNHIKTDWRPMMPFIIYFAATLCIMPFQNGMPLSEMFQSWRADAMFVLILPFVTWNIAKFDKNSIGFFRKTMLFCIAIAVSYGLFLTTTAGINPYMASLTSFMENLEDLAYYYEVKGGRMFGRISSVFYHPMAYDLFLGLFFIYIFHSRKFLKKFVFLLFMIAIIASAITCGVRSVLGGLLVTIVYYFFMCRNFKMMAVIINATIVGYFIISSIPKLSSYVGSVGDIQNKNAAVSGSSVEMRLEQLQGALDESSKNPVFGLGYGWTSYFLKIKFKHPVCLAFESLIYVIICNFALIGFFIWGYLFLSYMRNNRKFKLSEIILYDCLIIFYLTYSCITGEYGYMKLFAIFYIMMLCNQLQIKKKRKSLIASDGKQSNLINK